MACNNSNLKQIFLVHGDEINLAAMQQTLLKDNYTKVEVPDFGDSFML